MKCRYVYCPMTPKRIGRRVTLMERVRRSRARRRHEVPDVYEVIGYCAPIFPGK